MNTMFLKKGLLLLFISSLLFCALAQDYCECDHFGEMHDCYDHCFGDQHWDAEETYEKFGQSYEFPQIPYQESEFCEQYDCEFYDCDLGPICDCCWEHQPNKVDAIDIILKTMPNIPEELINEIRQANPGFLDYIIQRHPNFVKLILNMEPSTIEHFCRHVPSFGIRLGYLNPHSLLILRNRYPKIDSCIVRPRINTTRAPTVSPTTAAATLATATATTTASTMASTTSTPKNMTASGPSFLRRLLDALG